MSASQLSTLVANYTENTDATFVANIPFFIDMAEKRTYNAVNVLAQRAQVTNLTTTLGNQYMTMPADFLAPYSLAVIAASGARTFVLNKDVEFIDEAYPIPTVVGTPVNYALFSQTLTTTKIILGPTPDAAYATDIQYYAYPQSIVTATNTWLGDNFPMVLLYGVLREAAIYMKSEPDMIQNYEAKYQEALGLLKQMSEGKERQDTYRSKQARQGVT
jgi:hypothetical protein